MANKIVIKDYPNFSIDSNTGDIYRGKKKIIPTKRIDGYCIVNLKNFKGKKAILHHRLVAINLIENPYNKPCVNHIDGIKDNCKPTNLEWVTYSENMRHSADYLYNYNGPNNPNAKFSTIDLSNIKRLRKKGLTLEQIGAKYGSSCGTISRICKNMGLGKSLGWSKGLTLRKKI